MDSDKLDKRFYHDIYEYYDGLSDPLPPHLDRSWNIGLIFARHCGVDKDIAYVAPAAATFGSGLRATIELLKDIGCSCQILEK
jgi:hypothetical protein